MTSDLQKTLCQYFPDLLNGRFTVLPTVFEDSSHQIWFYDDAGQRDVIKLLNSVTHDAGPFWQGMRALFDVDLPQQISKFETLYPMVADATELRIPALRQLWLKPSAGLWGLRTDCLPGRAMTAELVTSEMVAQLAHHLAGLHRVSFEGFGDITCPEFNRQNHQAWSNHLKTWLEQQATPEKGVPASERDALLAECDKVFQPDVDAGPFGIIMPDLRWDQFLQQDGRLTGLTDLDALVAGPIALDWVLVELLLNENQFDEFCNEYQKVAEIPTVSEVRAPYRAALFLMNVFGESNYQVWQKRPVWLD
jgi:hypothetical protein